MDLQPSEEQDLIRQGAAAVLRRHGGVERVRALDGGYDAELEAALSEAGYLSTVDGAGGSGLEAAFVLEAVAMGLGTASVGALGLVAPMLGLELRGPVAMSSAAALDAGVPLRYGAVGGHVLVPRRSEAQLCRVVAATPVPRPWGYPCAQVEVDPGTDLGVESAETLRAWWWVSVAVEIVGNATMALDQALRHVKERYQFGRPLGQFQSTQHRLAQVSVKVEGARWLAWRAAWSGSSEAAALAGAHAVSAGTRAVAECHQVCGAIGLTTEFDLHLWTMRISALCAEVGGTTAMQAEAGRRCWPASVGSADLAAGEPERSEHR
jgi:alkylation response protein AidB-like acyl-CoA dehydrogenase